MSTCHPRTPRLGDTVLYADNDDLCPSPATVIGTAATMRADVLAAQAPTDPATGAPVTAPTSPCHLHLLVHGLVRDYRRYDVACAPELQPGCWTTAD